MSNTPLVVDIDSLRGIFADRDAALVLYDPAGRRINDSRPTRLTSLAPARIADVLASAELLTENDYAQVWSCEIGADRSGYLVVHRDPGHPRPSILIIASGEGQRWRVLNNLPIGILALDQNFRATMSNVQAAILLQQERDEILDDGWRRRFPLEVLNAILAHFDDPRRASMPFRQAVSLCDENHVIRHIDLTVVAQWRASTEPDGFYLSMVDIGREHAAREKLARSASEDGLTHVMNRRSFEKAIDELPESAKRHLGMAFIDLDNFKPLNDRLGHTAGDEMLRIVAMRLKAAVRDTDYVARLGGDEFVVAFTSIHNDDHLESFGEKLRLLLNDSATIGGEVVPLTASIGLALGARCLDTACADRPESFSDCLIRRADAAMYQAKGEGKGTVRIYTDSLDAELAVLQQRQDEYQRALSDGDFLSVFQPILSGRETVAVEALTRVMSGLEAHSGIEQFIETGKRDRSCHTFLDLLTQRAIDTYGGHASRFTTLEQLTLNLNVDVMQLLRPDFATQLVRWCQTSSLPPSQVCIEITETALEQNPRHLMPALNTLRDGGFSLSMDDFGTGYSSLKRLLLYEFDQIKIDRFFIERALRSEKYRAVLSAMVALGRSASIQMLAEGIESKEELDLCRNAGIELLQGFHLARPAPLGELFDLAPGLG